jgi:signal transduction histidine kinase
MAKVTVTDTGVGIQPEDLPHVFDRLWRGEKSRSRASGGTGLGLAIARQLVELHGGRIGVESTPGQGSAFWFSLPAA